MKIKAIYLAIFLIFGTFVIYAQQTFILGKGNTKNVSVTTSNSGNTGIRTLMSSAFLPNQNASSRFLSQATLGATYSEIQKVSTQGVEKWLDDQFALPNAFKIESYLLSIHQ